MLKAVTYPSGTTNTGNDTVGTMTRSTNGQLVNLAWATVGGTAITSDAVTRSQSGRTIDRSIDGIDGHVGNNYTYDRAGRLTAARVAGAPTSTRLQLPVGAE